MLTRAPGTMRQRDHPRRGRALPRDRSRRGGTGGQRRACEAARRSLVRTVDSSARLHLDEEELERARRARARRRPRWPSGLGASTWSRRRSTASRPRISRSGGTRAMEGPVRRRLELAPEAHRPVRDRGHPRDGRVVGLEHGSVPRVASIWPSAGSRRRCPGRRSRRCTASTSESAARFRLGDWDGVLADVALAEELLGDRRDSPPGFAPMHIAIAAFVHDARGDRGTASRYLDLVRWLEEAEERLDRVLTLWQARLLARRGTFEEARALLGRPERSSRIAWSSDEVLEAWCEVISEEAAWDEAAEARGAGDGATPLGRGSLPSRSSRRVWKGRAAAAGTIPRTSRRTLVVGERWVRESSKRSGRPP